ncbi:2Fe-2S iron-sulfur cluster protein [Advenella incenata]|uniref:2Fe-2S iron-sulfur cluster protein n=2 Tax=Advenella incenata TaxID=267800 RepID=A0A4Q7VQ16_9BURK|nr:(2Fe-2S)-binding protein [Advenella incenata]RZT98248.1 2Fe-2S iron-sulfur cluster protein [Advenella incenata]
MFKRIDGVARRPKARITVDERPVYAEEGTTLAIALLEVGCIPTRHHQDEARAPYCLMGACFECLVHVDGASNVQSCQIKVRAGMVVRRPNGPREA